jgi:hypothetical protein
VPDADVHPVDDLGPDALERELVALGRALVVDPPPDDLAARVTARVSEPAPTREAGQGWARGASRPRRLAWAAAAAVVLVVALVPPVRAAVLELLHLGGVTVRQEPAPAPPATGAATPGPGSTPVSLDAARRSLGIPFALPASLGPPDAVALAHAGRVAELTWSRGGVVTRLDVFAGSPDWGYLKTVWQDVRPTTVGRYEAIWIGAPHRLEWVDATGAGRPDPAQVAGPTLVWVVPAADADVTYRLEGPTTLDAALGVARSAVTPTG